MVCLNVGHLLMKKAVSEFLQNQWLNVLESIDEGMVVVDREGTIEFMNEAAALLIGQSATLAIGAPASRVLKTNPWAVGLLVGPDAPSDHAIHLEDQVLRSPSPVPVHASATPLREEDGTRVGTLLTLQDRTHQRELAARGRESERLSELETLVAGLAHEIRNPLSGIRGAAQLLSAQSSKNPKAVECTEIVVEEIDRLEGLMSQLLELSGPPRGERVAVNVHKLLEHVVGIETASRPESRFVRQFDPSLPPVFGDPARLTQVLLNLVRNAVDANPENERVVLATRMETTYRLTGTGHAGRFLSIEVKDHGAGVPDKDLERIFSPFYTTKSHGTGLGLAISQRIVSEHGGVLRARNTAGQGATFTVTLPVDSGTNHGA